MSSKAERKDKYENEGKMLGLVMEALEGVDLDYIGEVLSSAEAIGPLFFPSEYMRGGSDNLSDMRAVIGPAKLLKKAWAEVKERRGLK